MSDFQYTCWHRLFIHSRKHMGIILPPPPWWAFIRRARIAYSYWKEEEMFA